MMKLDKDGNFNPWCQPSYGTDSNDEKVTPPEGYYIIPKREKLLAGDIPFDVYAGWLKPNKPPKNPKRCKYPNLFYYRMAVSEGRWTTWARPTIHITIKPIKGGDKKFLKRVGYL